MTHKPSSPTVGDRVRGALATARISQTEAASAIRLKQSQLSRRINGHVPWQPGEVEGIARLCEVPIESLLGREPVWVAA